MKFNALRPGVSGEFYQKRLFIFLTKQFENSSLINGIGRREILVLRSRARLASPSSLPGETGTPRLMVFLSSSESSENSVDIHKYRKHPQVKTYTDDAQGLRHNGRK